MAGPSTKPSPKPAETSPKFCAFFSGADTSAMKACAVDMVAAAAPATMRPTRSSQIVPASAMIT